MADALLNAAAAWLKSRGFDTMRGPASFSTNDESGLLVDGFDTPPALMMPHNPPYYLALLERAGFTTAKNLLVYQHGLPDGNLLPVPERLARATELITKRLGLTVPVAQHEATSRPRWTASRSSTTRPGRRTGASFP